MKLLLILLLVYEVYNKNVKYRSLSGVIQEAPTDSQNKMLYKQKFLFPYVKNIYSNMEKYGLVTGSVRFLIPIEGMRAIESQRVEFNISSINKGEMTAAHLVVSEEEEPSSENITITYLKQRLVTVEHTHGLIADVTGILQENLGTVSFILDWPNMDINFARIILSVFVDMRLSMVNILESVRGENRDADLGSVPWQKTNENLRSVPRQKRESDQIFNNAHTNGNMSSFNAAICSVKPWLVDVDVLGWDWWLIPPTYQANMCQGLCPSPVTHKYYNASNFAIVKNFYHIATNFQNNSTPRACCVPTKFLGLSVMYLHKDNGFTNAYIPDMKVTACGCL